MLRLCLLLIALSSHAVASCPHLYPQQTPIYPRGTVELCNDRYVVVYNERLRTPISASELIEITGHVVKRKDSFHSDRRVINPVQPADYFKTGMDRGHLVPADNSISAHQMYESFLMTNMAPQHPKLNRGPWRALEQRTQQYAALYDSTIYAITGVLFTQPRTINGVATPSHWYKIVYLPTHTKAYIAENTASGTVQQTTVSNLNQLSGITFPLYAK